MSEWAEMTIANRIRVAAQMRRMTIQDVAKKAKVPRSTLYHIIGEASVPHLDNLVSIAHALNVRIGWLVEGEEPISRVPETTKTAPASSPVPRRQYPLFEVPSVPIVPAASRRRQKKHKG